jgi:hypothetical protein
MNSLCKNFHISVGADDPICEGFASPSVTKEVKKKQESASDRIALIAKEIECLRLDPACHDRMVYDSLSTIETMMKHLSTSIKNTERDFMMEVVTNG